MKTIINTSTVTDYSGETPIAVVSNPVTTLVRQPPPVPISIRYFYRLPCCCCRCRNGCGCQNRCGCRNCRRCGRCDTDACPWS